MLDAYNTVIRFIYHFLDFRMDYFGISLSFSEILVGLICFSIVIYCFFRISD